VDELWSSHCAWPEPPHPATQLELLDWDWLALWLVDAVFDAEDVAELLRFWLALLDPDGPT
jgi:hypothetical protein